MVGDFESKLGEQKAFFQRNQIVPHATRIAIDLGCGHGLQAVALSQLGFEVIAIDFNRTMLDELRQKSIKGINVVEGDLMEFDMLTKARAEIIVCMGDTLTHLNTVSDVNQLILKSREQLSDNGKLVLSFRDLSNPLNKEQRFLPVKSDESKIHTCFLEYFDDHVQVYDLLHENIEGNWVQLVSSYPKLILTPALVKSYLKNAGFRLTHEEVINRMNYLIAEKY